MSSSMSPRDFAIQSVERKLRIFGTGGSNDFTGLEVQILQEAFTAFKGVIFDTTFPADEEDTNARETIVNVASAEKNYCYLSLVRIIPSYKTSPIETFQAVLDCFATGLGPEPKGKDVMVNLCIMEMVLNDELTVDALRMDTFGHPKVWKAYHEAETHLKTLSKMAEAPNRYTITEEGGRMHVIHRGVCGCSDILCSHGWWATRYILQAIARDGQTLGADIDMSKLFITTDRVPDINNKSSIQQTPLSAHVDKTLNYDKLTSEPLRVQPRPRAPHVSYDTSRMNPPANVTGHQESERLRAQVSDDLVSMLEGHLDSRTEALENALAMLMEERKSKSQPVNRGYGSSNNDDSDIESTICPVDSSSSLGRYEKSFMRSGPVYNVGKSSTVLSPVNEEMVMHSDAQIDVVRGFIKTDSMRQIERQTVDKVYTINGLACPFKDSRLNFLTHFHTALSTCGIDPKSEPIDALEYIGLHKPQNPTEELIKQCMLKTFDFDEMTVIANPFKLPFIEIGMLISESMLAKCLTLLRSEYRSAWFSEMKCLKVPSFHDEFSQYSTATMNRTSTRSRSKPQRRGSNQTSGDSESGDRNVGVSRTLRVKKQRTILGMPV